MNRTEVMQKENGDSIIICILYFFGFFSFILYPTAYTWGEQDIMPFLERSANKNFLPQDFFVNASMQKSPRWIYGYAISGISWITGQNWYRVLYVLKLIILIVNPVIHYKVIKLILQKYIGKSKASSMSIAIVLAIGIVMFSDVNKYFSIGGWLPYNAYLHAYSVSLVLSFIAIILKETKSKYYLIYFFLSCLFHPIMGLFAIGFYLIFLIPFWKTERKEIIKITATVLFCLVSIKILFSGEVILSTKNFIYYYVLERHPHHYHVPDFTHRYGNWKYYFFLFNLLFLVPFIYGTIKKNRRLK